MLEDLEVEPQRVSGEVVGLPFNLFDGEVGETETCEQSEPAY